MLLAGPPGLGKTSLAQIVANELERAASCRPPARRSSARATSPRYLTALEPRSRLLRRRDPPAAARARGDLLPGDGGPQAADHGRPGRGRARRHARPAGVHADRRDHARRAADHAAARPLRRHAPARALRRRRPRPDRAPLGRRSSTSRSTTPAREAIAAPLARHAARGEPAAQARARLRRGARRRARSTRRVAARGARPARGRRGRASTGSTARSCATICEKFGGGPVGLSTLAVAVGEEPDTIEDVYEPYLLQQGLLKRTPRGRVATAAAFEHLGPGSAPRRHAAPVLVCGHRALANLAFGHAELHLPQLRRPQHLHASAPPASRTARAAARSAASASCSSCSTTTTRRPTPPSSSSTSRAG